MHFLIIRKPDILLSFNKVILKLSIVTQGVNQSDNERKTQIHNNMLLHHRSKAKTEQNRTINVASSYGQMIRLFSRLSKNLVLYSVVA